MTVKPRLLFKIAAALALVGTAYVIRSHSGAAEHIGWAIAGWALTAFVVVRIALSLWRGRAALKVLGDEPLSIKTVGKATMSAVPAWAQGWSKSEMKIYGGFWRALRGVPLPRDQRFTVSQGPRSALVSAGAAALVALLAAGGFALLGAWSTSHKSLLIGVASIAGPALYLLVMLAGERRVLKETGHVVTGDVLSLALGIRFGADIALADVLACAPNAGGVANACVVSPFETPNVLLTLRDGAVVDARRFGYPFRPGTSTLALYVDQPAGFVGTVGAALARQLPRYA